MTIPLTILYAFRDRDCERVNFSLCSLRKQVRQCFEVVFVDYGSHETLAKKMRTLVGNFSFANYHYIAHEGLLWNKSKALNYGIKHANGEFIFIADVDVIFHPDATRLFEFISNPKMAFLFKLSYLSKEETKGVDENFEFNKLKASHTGSVNGMILAHQKAFMEVHGLDEFFHFYGSEDVDLFERLKHHGIKIKQCQELYFKHIWHEIYNSYDDSNLSTIPRLFNIKRINQQRFFYNKKYRLVIPLNQKEWGIVEVKESKKILDRPDVVIELKNIHAIIVHFFEVELKNYKDEIVKIVIHKDDFFESMKHKIKIVLKRKVQPYMTMKVINDIILSQIIYQYRDNNYSYDVSEDFKRITFIVQLK